ncbi:hypothetical protein BH93_27640 (plasmid) [Rhodococcoides fascians A25f]|nr:hypothetical protein [Rhodococcus fascians]QII09346.1 hypothetical protein BH93_27640 [Rhodococcus fascians A25f]
MTDTTTAVAIRERYPSAEPASRLGARFADATPRARRNALNVTPSAAAAADTSPCSASVNRTGTTRSRIGSTDFGLPR